MSPTSSSTKQLASTSAAEANHSRNQTPQSSAPLLHDISPNKPLKRLSLLVYRGLKATVDLKTFLPPKFGNEFLFNGISPSGQIFVLITKTKFAIMTRQGPICDRKIHGTGGVLSPYELRRPKKSSLLSIKTIALGDKHFFIGTETFIVVFAIFSGKVVCMHELDPDFNIDKLVLSLDGNTLLALSKSRGGRHQRAYLFSTTKYREAPPFSGPIGPIDKIDWEDETRIHSGATFSADGRRIAIYTSHCERQSEIRFLQKVGEHWVQPRAPLGITVVSDNADARLADKGVTGAAMYDLSSLHLSLIYIVYITNTWSCQ